MAARQSARLERKKFFGDPVMVVTIAVLIALLLLFIVYPLAILLVDSVLVRENDLYSAADLAAARASSADFILLDNGAGGTGEAFDRSLLAGFDREYILAGGLDSETVGSAVRALRPFAVDVSSGIETGGFKDTEKMRAFVEAVRAVPAEPGEEDGK